MDVDLYKMLESSAFLEGKTYRLLNLEHISGGLWAFGNNNKDEGYENNSYSSDDVATKVKTYEKIESAFSMMSFKSRFCTILQLWAPVTNGGKHQLSTSGQPFGVNKLNVRLKTYRGLCVRECSRYDIDVNRTIRGTPASAFLNHCPEIAQLYSHVHEDGSFFSNAFRECRLKFSVMIPIYCSSSSFCIGVIECSSTSPMDLEIVNTMTRALKQKGLNVFDVQDCIPNYVNGVRDEIQEALNREAFKRVFESHKIGVAQVWISRECENHVPFSFSQTTRRVALKLTGYHNVDEDPKACHRRFKEYYDACDIIPLQRGVELVEKTLQDYRPRFCQQISLLGNHTLMAWVSDDDVFSSFTISVDIGDLSCAFEFIWHHNPDYIGLLRKLLLTLKMLLPRFKFPCDADLDQSEVIYVDFFNIFKGKRTTKEIILSREEILQHYGKTERQAAKDLQVSLSTLKRKCKHLGISGWQGTSQQKKLYNPDKNQGNDSQITVIKAEYADDIIRLHLLISEATFVTVENEIGKEFKLKHGTFKIYYIDEDDDWILMKNDQDFYYCIQSSRNVDRSVVRLRVRLHNQ